MPIETNERHIHVIGHRHPDTDSICAAISYANLKNKLGNGPVCVPCRAGDLNRETEYALKAFKVPKPRMLMDVSPQVRDVDIRQMEGVSGDMSLRQAWTVMRDKNIDTLCIVDGENQLQGVITVKDIATANMDGLDPYILAESGTSYQNIIETLNATVEVGDPAGKQVEGRIIVGSGSAEAMERVVSKGDIVIVTNRSESQLAAIEMEAGCVVICAKEKLSRTVCMLAEEKGCVILSTPHSTYVAGQMISQSAPIGHYMVKENLITFTMDTTVEAASKVMASVRLRYFPVLDDDGRYLGVVSRRNLMNLHKKRVIMVDHNERDQAVEGIDQAELLEIIDHHRIGVMETDGPVYFRNVPVGCTCTIVDEAAARELAAIAEVDIEAYSNAMFEAGGDVSGKSAEEIFNGDYKLFGTGDIQFGVGQGSYMTEKNRKASEALVAPYLETARVKQSLQYVFYMFTDVRTSSTDLFMAGPNAEKIVRRAFEVEAKDGMALLPGVVSRKKQLIPALIAAIKQQAEEDQ